MNITAQLLLKSNVQGQKLNHVQDCTVKVRLPCTHPPVPGGSRVTAILTWALSICASVYDTGTHAFLVSVPVLALYPYPPTLHLFSFSKVHDDFCTYTDFKPSLIRK